MTITLSKPQKNIYSIAVIAFLIFAGGAFILHVVPPTSKNRVANGLLVDCIITLPALYYLIIVRPLKVSVKQMLFVSTICCSIAFLILPQQQRKYILQIRKLTAIVELAFIVYAVTKLRQIRAAYKTERNIFADPIFNLRSALAITVGQSIGVKIIAAEFAVLRYGLLVTKKEKNINADTHYFTTHKEFGYVAIWCVMLFAALIEISATHLLLMKWSNTAAIILTVLSCYGLILFVADLSAMLKRKVLINKDIIVLRTGMRWRAIVDRANISEIKCITNDYNSEVKHYKGGIIKNGNILITFKQPVVIEKLYGANEFHTAILLCIDDTEKFIREVF
ncbi:hypothetical protein ACVW0P_000279 [Mucilaginibacter sp. UYNi724]